MPVKPVVAAGQVERARQLVFAFTGSQTEACSQAATQIIQVRCQPCPLIVVVKDEQRGNNDIPPTLGTNKRLLSSEPGEISFIHHDSCAMYTMNRWCNLLVWVIVLMYLSLHAQTQPDDFDSLASSVVEEEYDFVAGTQAYVPGTPPDLSAPTYQLDEEEGGFFHYPPSDQDTNECLVCLTIECRGDCCGDNSPYRS